MLRFVFLLIPVKRRARVVGYMNIYQSGHFHRAGKPNMYDRHPGDIYPSYEAAVADVDPPNLYLCTVKVTWYEDIKPVPNGADSKPIPLSVSRRMLKDHQGGYVQWDARVNAENIMEG